MGSARDQKQKSKTPKQTPPLETEDQDSNESWDALDFDETPEQMRAAVMQALYDAAQSGNISAIDKWLTLHPPAVSQPKTEEPDQKKGRSTKSKSAPAVKEEVLTTKELAFVENYLGAAKGNGTEACRLAGYAGNDNVLAVTAHRMLRKPKIRELIDARLAQIAMPVDEVLKVLSDHARGSIEPFLSFAEGAAPAVALQQARDAGKLHLVKGISFHQNGHIKNLQFHSSYQAAVMLGRYHGVFDATDKPPDQPEPEAEARAYESARDYARFVVETIAKEFKLTLSEAAKRVAARLPAAQEWTETGSEGN